MWFVLLCAFTCLCSRPMETDLRAVRVSQACPPKSKHKTGLSNRTDGRIVNVTFDMADLMEIKLPLLHAMHPYKVAHAMH
jgi:hypothetical protein